MRSRIRLGIRARLALVLLLISLISSARRKIPHTINVRDTILPWDKTRRQRVFRAYHELKGFVQIKAEEPDQLGELSRKGTFRHRRDAYSAFSRAQVVKQAPWLPSRKMCKETCCVESVAISLEQDEHQIIQQRDGVDLADLVLPHRRLKPEHLKYHGQTLHPAMLPCLVPGTIITLENHRKQTIYFWHKLRQHIQVPYILLTTGSDNDSPECYEQYIADPLLIRWYGTNPINRSHPLFQQNLHKFKSLNLGLSFQRPQERHLLPYLQLNNFTNPFLNKRKWDFSRKDFSFKDDMFVQFGLHTPHRKQLWNLLCPNTTTTSSSCNTNTVSLEVHQLYSDMSQYRFGISPPGHGYDCYRTYEMLLLGVIPIVEKSSTKDLFEDLPVIQMEDLASVSSRQDFVDAIQNYIASDAFQNANFQRGWERLFLKSRRQELLQVSQREKEVLVDLHGMRYYQAYQYTVLGNNHGHLQQLEDCEYGCNVEDEDAITDWVDTPLPKLTEDEINWLQDWERSSQLPQFQFLQSMY